MTQRQVANTLGIVPQQIQKYEVGASRVSASMLIKLAAKLETTVAALVGESGGIQVESVILSQATLTGAAELLAAFASLDDGDVRRDVLEMVHGLVRKSAEKRGLAS
jgi:transcriptional regulator with XRE-family HTH domain